MKNIIMTLLIAFTFALSASESKHDHKHDMPQKVGKAQAHCPIRGGEIDKEVFTDYQGFRIYYCCPGCDKKFLQAPEQHLAAMKAKGIALTKIQTSCPVSGEDVTRADVIIKSTEGDVALCCKKCVKKFKANPKKYLAKLTEQGVTIGAIAQETKEKKAHDHSGHDH